MTSTISPREKDVLQLMAREMTTKEIAGILSISQHTVISHRKNLMEKLAARNAVGIIVRAVRLGVLNLTNENSIY